MDYKYQYITNIILGYDIKDTETSVGASRRSIGTTKNGKSGELNTLDVLPNYIYNKMDDINKHLSKYEILLDKNDNTLENGGKITLVIKSNEELDVGAGISTIALGFKNGSKVILLTFEPVKLIYNSYVKELDQKLIATIQTDYSLLYITMVNKLDSIKDDDLINDITEILYMSDNLSRFKDISEALKTLISLVRASKKIKNKEIIINSIREIINIYIKMEKDYKLIRSVRVFLDIHTGNWKIVTDEKGKKLIAIDPFVIYYGTMKIDADFLNKLGKEFIKNNRK